MMKMKKKYSKRKPIEFGWVSKTPNYIDIKHANLLVSHALIVRQMKSGKTLWSLLIPWSSMN